MELLARFELATSSLPKISPLFCLVVACCRSTQKVVAPQRFFGIAYRSLLLLDLYRLCLIFAVCLGFVLVFDLSIT